MSAGNVGKLVVVIDDDPLVVEATGSLLRTCGYHVVAATSYSEAMDRLDELGRQADLIVCGAITNPVDGLGIRRGMRVRNCFIER